ncbi:DUF2637 domain-containing protein [Streptomyces sp. B1866]|uniref:DUF2637 domain-containing protein n=1 Tax=Streptomyces sp. B1866 TaxID=3075431 RepID=UPI00288CE858|nr:DUF2637 domain-containing protein [Streptomyces sp. B1866]MDT3395283.1 DUF2637 domain-containing protein [Streptomyces sp. B1866]
MTTTAPAPARITGWDRATVVALGAAASALSYAALQQVAAAIHVRGLLTYLFPLVIDGFIAYGVRALVVLRTARFGPRLYVWTLFGTATAVSVWANALHAVRINQQHAATGSLRLGSSTVGILSTVAPLALAGAVHLYILIARHASEDATDGNRAGDLRCARAAAHAPADTTDLSSTDPGHRFVALSRTPGPADGHAPVTGDKPGRSPRTQTGPRTTDHAPSPVPGTEQQEERQPTRDLRASDTEGTLGDGPPSGGRSEMPAPVTCPRTLTDADRQADTITEQLLPIARKAVADTGRTTRAVVAQAIRGQGLPLSNDRLTELMRTLRDDPGQPTGHHTA